MSRKIASLWGIAIYLYKGMPEVLDIQPQLFQQFNPFFVVLLTPVIMAIFNALAADKSEKHPEGREPSVPMKIRPGFPPPRSRAQCRPTRSYRPTSWARILC